MRGTLLVAGTGSDAGKSVLVAGLCRWLARQGVQVAPFKAQNMSLNSFVTLDGAEIGRAQAMQAAAAGIEPSADMNPVLLKPGSDRRSQVVVLGHPETEADAVGYRAHAPRLRQVALDSLARLRDAYDVVICEGAGSPAEINLRETDVANMGLARAAGLPVIVTGDIDRGGVFAAMYGTLALLSPEDQALVSGFVINKFRGAPELLDSGLVMLRQLTGRPVYGVLPWQDGLGGDAEDSLGLPPPSRSTALDHGTPANSFGTKDFLRVAVVRLPRISNFTDVDAVAAEPGVLVRFATSPADLADADLVVLPGSRATVADLAWLRDRGLANAVTGRARAGRPVLGICGGYQMMAGQIDDPVESGRGLTDGLGLLPVRVRFGAEKVLGRPGAARWARRWPGTRSITASPRSPTRPQSRSLTAAAAARCGAPAGTARWRTTSSGGRSWPRWRHWPAGTSRPPRHRLRRRAEGAARRARRPGDRPPGHRGAGAADRRRAGARPARACHITEPRSIGFLHARQGPYTAKATSTGAGRSGHVVSPDHRLDLDLALPVEMGGDGNGTNPEQLFAAGYSACFHSALRIVARRAGVDPGESTVTAEVGIGSEGEAYGLVVTLVIHIPGLDREQARELAEAAHQVCPYSRATRGNISVELRIP